MKSSDICDRIIEAFQGFRDGASHKFLQMNVRDVEPMARFEPKP